MSSLSNRFININFWCLPLCILYPILLGCAHYELVNSSRLEFDSIAIGEVINLTDEPRISSYFQNLLPESIMLDGSLRIEDRYSADSVINIKIISYEVGSVAEVQIKSQDSSQRRYRTSVFNVTLHIEYELKKNSESAEFLRSPEKVESIAEFSELVDLDVVKKDGLRKVTYNVCNEIVSSIVDQW